MTELSFLIKLLLDEKLPLELKQMIADRIKEVEEKIQTPATRGLVLQGPGPAVQMMPVDPQQSPSMQKIIASGPPLPVTPAAANALAHRQQLINQATSGKQEPGRDSPRKF